MNNKYLIRLTDEERNACQTVIKKLKCSSEKVRRAQILLKADADGPGWRDVRLRRLSTAGCKRLRIRKRLVTEGFEQALERKKRAGTAESLQTGR